MALLVGSIFFVAAFVGLMFNHLDYWDLPIQLVISVATNLSQHPSASLQERKQLTIYTFYSFRSQSPSSHTP
ncbi:MAG: hypothetical protein ACRERD_17150, partial [Candidatus Binatia bacterium]